MTPEEATYVGLCFRISGLHGFITVNPAFKALTAQQQQAKRDELVALKAQRVPLDAARKQR